MTATSAATNAGSFGKRMKNTTIVKGVIIGTYAVMFSPQVSSVEYEEISVDISYLALLLINTTGSLINYFNKSSFYC